MLPYVAQIVAAFYTEAVEVGRKLLCGVGGVDYGDGVASVAERAHEDLMRVGVHLAFSRNAEWVLVDGDNLAVEQYAAVVGSEVPQVVGHGERRTHHAPDAHLCLVFRPCR